MKNLRALIFALLAFAVILTGCGAAAKPANQALEEATEKLTNANSYAMSGSFVLKELTLPDELAQDPNVSMLSSLLKDATVSLDAVYRKEPMRMDANINVKLSGSFPLDLTVPIIVDDQKVYVQIPQIPFVPISPDLIGKFVVIDASEAAELAEQSGAGDISASLDPELQKKLGEDVLAIVFKHLDAKTFLSEPKASEVELPEGLKADRIVRLSINESNYDQTVQVFFDKIIPELIELIATNEEVLKAANITKENVDELRTEFNENKEEALKVIKDSFKIKNFDFVSAISGDFLTYQNSELNLEITSPETGEKLGTGFTAKSQFSDINKDPKFLHEIPADAMTVDELIENMY